MWYTTFGHGLFVSFAGRTENYVPSTLWYRTNDSAIPFVEQPIASLTGWGRAAPTTPGPHDCITEWKSIAPRRTPSRSTIFQDHLSQLNTAARDFYQDERRCTSTLPEWSDVEKRYTLTMPYVTRESEKYEELMMNAARHVFGESPVLVRNEAIAAYAAYCSMKVLDIEVSLEVCDVALRKYREPC